MKSDNLTVVIRSADERTAAACRGLIAREIDEENIVTVSNAPFSATLADCYRVGIERGLSWTLCIDADVLVADGSMGQLLEVAAKAPENVCEIQGLVLDKLFGVRRPAGNHLYRTSLLSKALRFIPPEGRAIRPEHHTLSKMVGEGHPWIEVPVLVGLHDFEQYYRDIFRKCYVHARKFDGEIHLLANYWRRMAGNDDDYVAALAGLAAGIIELGEVRVDVRGDCGFAKWAESKAWTEKEALEPARISPDAVERILDKWISPGGVLERSAGAYSKEVVHDGSSASGVRRVKRPGVTWRFLPWAGGRALEKLGRRLVRISGGG